ncbi:hypothetical protein B0H13DRAFT_1503498, partial [Mycena leptocephala]
ACMSLQTADPTEDAGVITAPSTLPFHCPEDLLTRPRAALVGVPGELSGRLPAALHISVARTPSDAVIRNEV